MFFLPFFSREIPAMSIQQWVQWRHTRIVTIAVVVWRLSDHKSFLTLSFWTWFWEGEISIRFLFFSSSSCKLANDDIDLFDLVEMMDGLASSKTTGENNVN